MTVLSPTSIQTYYTCPYQYYAKYITKEVKFEQNPHAKFGDEVHKNIENYLKHGAKLSPLLEPLRHTLDKMKTVLVGAETKIAITPWNTVCNTFFHNDAYLRCIVDAIISDKNHEHIIAFDWKTGKKRDAQVQHDTIKKCLSVKYPKAKSITTVFLYLFQGEQDIQEHKPNIPLVELEHKIQTITNAHKSGEFPYNPNGLCKQWCDVVSCPHNGKQS